MTKPFTPVNVSGIESLRGGVQRPRHGRHSVTALPMSYGQHSEASPLPHGRHSVTALPMSYGQLSVASPLPHGRHSVTSPIPCPLAFTELPDLESSSCLSRSAPSLLLSTTVESPELQGSTTDTVTGASDNCSRCTLILNRCLSYNCIDLVRQHLGHVEDRLFDMFGDREKRSININKFLMGLTATGMRPSDPRLKQTRDNLRKLQDNLGSEFVTLEVDYDTFMSIISENLEVVVRAFSASFVIPDFQGFCRQIEDIYNMCYANHSGKSAQYIPQLARFDSRSWGVSVCTVDGQRFSLGDVDVPFTIQSCSKPLTYGIGLAVNGTEYMHKYVGMEPSGRYFNDLVLDYDNKPHNPMINSGAIMTAAIIKPELSAADRFDFMFKVYKRLAGDEHLGFNNSVFLSERECADRNFALAYFMRENKCFPANHKLHESLDFYFQLCSLEITAESGAVMAATLANGGLNPLTSDPVLTVDAVRNTLTLMHSCGMYNYSGQFAFHVGLPAKSGVSGCVLLVIPNTMGICLWSPPLDSNGNSCRGVQFCMEMVSRFNFHNFDNLRGYAKSKKDPRTAKTESKAQIIFDLLFSSAAGDMSALRRHSLAGTDMQAKDYDGRTALHVATSEGHHEIVEFLLNKCQVDPLPKDRWDRTPLDDAESFDHPKCVKLITGCCKRKGIKLPRSYNECIDLGKENNGPLLEIDSL